MEGNKKMTGCFQTFGGHCTLLVENEKQLPISSDFVLNDLAGFFLPDLTKVATLLFCNRHCVARQTMRPSGKTVIYH